MSNADKQISAKRAWANLTSRALEAESRAQQNQKFLRIACIGLQIQAGLLGRGEAAAQLNALGITREDLQEFRRWHSPTPAKVIAMSAPACGKPK